MSTSVRLFQAAALIPHQSFWLDERATHYIARVLRATSGETLTLFNGQGGEYSAVITRVERKGVEVQVGCYIEREVESPIDIYLAQGISRGERMDIVVQKAVELGVTHFIPLVTERCNVRLSKEREARRIEHWQNIMVSACEQSGRNRLPYLSPPLTLMEWLPTIKTLARSVLSPHVVPSFSVNQWPMDCTSFVLLIGPEGGLSDQEMSLASHNDFLAFNLGPRILRTETAAITALSILQYQYGDLKKR